MYNRAIFSTLTHLQPEESSVARQTCKIIRYIQSPDMVRTVCSGIFRDIGEGEGNGEGGHPL